MEKETNTEPDAQVLVRVMHFGVNLTDAEDPMLSDAGDIQLIVQHGNTESFALLDPDTADQVAALLTEASAVARKLRAEHEAEVA